MEVNEAIYVRRSIRGYKPDPVSRKILEQIIDASQWAPSPGNMQPWEFAILGGKTMEDLKNRLYEKAKNNTPAELEFQPTLEVPEIYARRREERKSSIDAYLYPQGTENVEEKKRQYFLSGARLFNAPNAIIVYTDKRFLDLPWGIVSIGMIVQNICLAALSRGLGTCIMGRPADWPDMLRAMLGIPQSKVILLGIAIGYPDMKDKTNTTPRLRIPQESWVHWHGL